MASPRSRSSALESAEWPLPRHCSVSALTSRVFEQAGRFARIGAGIQMMPNSMKVLRGIGVEDGCAASRSRRARI